MNLIEIPYIIKLILEWCARVSHAKYGVPRTLLRFDVISHSGKFSIDKLSTIHIIYAKKLF